MTAQNALAAASGSNAELFGKMISQAETAVKKEEKWGSKPIKPSKIVKRHVLS